MKNVDNNEIATFGGGCFWCIEAVFEKLEGVESVQSGYAGGKVKNPAYREVTTGKTGHAEVVQVTFDPKIISFDKLLEVFFSVHDPTTLNKQGADVGTQYRSVIFYHDQSQKAKAEQYISTLNNSGKFEHDIVTEISPYNEFYVAEDYHQDYYTNNPSKPYCTYVIDPKVEKLERLFQDQLK